MRIKHFQGYGHVKAVKKSMTTIKDMYDQKFTKLVVEVSGNHEWGLRVNDAYDAFNWLVKRFDKAADYYTVCGQFQFNCDDTYVKECGLDVEHCTYTFVYPKSRNA